MRLAIFLISIFSIDKGLNYYKFNTFSLNLLKHVIL
jgi:hypothetical protein